MARLSRQIIHCATFFNLWNICSFTVSVWWELYELQLGRISLIYNRRLSRCCTHIIFQRVLPGSTQSKHTFHMFNTVILMFFAHLYRSRATISGLQIFFFQSASYDDQKKSNSGGQTANLSGHSFCYLFL